MKLLKLTALASAAAFATSAALAGHHAEGEKKGHHGHKLEKVFEKMDANGDGKVTEAEFKAHAAERADKKWSHMAEYAGDDGALTMEEAKAHKKAMKEKYKDKKKSGE